MLSSGPLSTLPGSCPPFQVEAVLYELPFDSARRVVNSIIVEPV